MWDLPHTWSQHATLHVSHIISKNHLLLLYYVKFSLTYCECHHIIEEARCTHFLNQGDTIPKPYDDERKNSNTVFEEQIRREKKGSEWKEKKRKERKGRGGVGRKSASCLFRRKGKEKGRKMNVFVPNLFTLWYIIFLTKLVFFPSKPLPLKSPPFILLSNSEILYPSKSLPLFLSISFYSNIL